MIRVAGYHARVAKRINRAIELLEQDQPIYYETVEVSNRGYEGGRAAAQTWADYITYEMEHGPFDVSRLHDFMRGLVDGGPTRSGHRTPTVIVTLPTSGTDEQVMQANSWMVRQVLAAGVHGILLCHAETPGAVRVFVESARYPFHKAGLDQGLGVGRRGGGGQRSAAAIWGIPEREYLDRADPWPLNPNGELLLGLKIENVRALANAEETTRVPGVAFAEWGPGDMGMSLGFPDQHDEPYPPEMVTARARVLAACKAANLAFLNQVAPENVVERIAEGVRIGAGKNARAAAEIGRQHTKRELPW
jgi:4-hydroxy-2-oxoheptanedioate aldolase